MSRKTADLSGVTLPVVLHCAECRFSEVGKYDWLMCHCPRLRNWSDLEANHDLPFTSIARELECHGDWFEQKMPDSPRGFQRFLCWLRSKL